ncbi:MAG: hypothetical protein QW707_09045 [Candidatus Bathyarchaeia archaeon]
MGLRRVEIPLGDKTSDLLKGNKILTRIIFIKPTRVDRVMRLGLVLVVIGVLVVAGLVIGLLSTYIPRTGLTTFSTTHEVTMTTHTTETGGVTSVTPPSEFGKKFNNFIASILSAATGSKVTLTEYTETAYGDLLLITAEYTLSPPIEDHSTAANKIKNELKNRGLREEVTHVSVTSNEAVISVGGPNTIEGRLLGMLEITIHKDSNTIEVSAQLSAK